MIDRQMVRLFRERMEAALEPLETELNVKFVVGNASYTPEIANFKVQALAVQADGRTVDKPASDFKRMASLYGLKPSDLGREFSINGKQLVLAGLQLRCRRYPILALGKHDGRKWKLPLDAVLRALRS